ncbi:MAG TPA: T9SS type A sorting domain-containing protein, partial [Bacteroidales bacterium]|nr:T9SS type A sorting domain-containing protein [Bacteroidales bacterium]
TLHFPIPGNMVMYSVYYASGVYGYVSGNNGYSDKAKADVFTAVAPHTKMVGAYFKFGKAKNGSGQDYKIAVHAWDNTGTGGAPGNILFTDSLSCAQIQSDINMNTYTFLPFATPYDVTGVFYLGIMLPTNPGDTIVLLTNKNGESMPGTAWELWQNDNWLPYSNIASWSYNLSHAIFPVLCNPVTYSVEENKADDILVYPNPANGIINIDFGSYYHENVAIKVYDLLGNEVKSFNHRGGSTNHLQMDLGGFANGFYVLHINTGEQSLVKKISLLK